MTSRKSVLLAAAVVSILGGAEATAQNAAAPTATGIEEVFVTARRREESLQEIPLAVANVTAADLEARSVDSLEDLSATIPNVNLLGGFGGTNATRFSMRGIPGVATYIDGIWQQTTTGLLNSAVVDLERIEVLRGPQGTLFGRDAIGGAIRMWTRRPSDTFGGTVSATVGSLSRADMGLSVDIPLADSLRTKWTASSVKRDGYVHSTRVDQDFGSQDDTYLRGDIVWTPTDKLDIRLVADKSQMKGAGQPKTIDALLIVPGNGGFANPNANTVVLYNAAGLSVTPQNQVAGFPGGQVGEWQNTSLFSGVGTDLDHSQYSLDIRYTFSDAFAVQLLTGYVETDDRVYNDWDGSNVVMLEYQQYNKSRTFSEELQLSGQVGRFDWVAGAYYWDTEGYARRYEYYMYEFFNGQLDRNVAAANMPGCNLACVNSILRPAADQLTWAGQDGYAGFGEVTMAVTDKLNATVGMRYHNQTNENARLTFNPNVAPKPVQPGVVPVGDVYAGVFGPIASNEFSKNTMRAALNYQWTPDVMTYVSYSEGFTSGGQSQTFTAVNPNPPGNTVSFSSTFEPETLGNYELGLRSEWLDGRLRLNATLFYMDYKDVQINSSVVDPFGRILTQLAVQNLADGEAKGIELEATYVPADDWLVTVNGGYLETEYTDVAPFASFLRTTSQFGQAPEYTANMGVQKIFQLPNSGQLMARVDYSYVAEFLRDRAPEFQRTTWDPTLKKEAGDYGLVNARLGYTNPGDQWEIALFGTNLTNERYVNSGFYSVIWNFDFGTVGRPREYGATLKFNF